MEKEKVSIIVPVYNVEKYIKRCIDSIVNQTYNNLEIILVDDGSPDNSGTICDEYAKKDSRIKVIHQTNQGVSAARNHGIESSNGELIAFIDSDDFIDKDYIKTLYTNIYDSDIISCNFKTSYSDNVSKRNYKMPSRPCVKTSATEIFSDCVDSMIYTYVIWGKLYRKDVLKNIYFKEQAYSEDALFVREVFLNCKSIRLIPYDGYNYFICEQSVTNDVTRINEKSMGALNMLFCTWNMCKKNQIKVNYNIIEKQIIGLLNGILKYSLKDRSKISDEICSLLPAIKSFQSVKHMQYLKIYCAVKILVIIKGKC